MKFVATKSLHRNGYDQLKEMSVPRWAKALIDKLAAEHEVVKTERDDLAFDVGGLSAERDSLLTRCGLLEAERDALREDKARLLGWRENDWPEGFCRRTAEALCEHVKGEER